MWRTCSHAMTARSMLIDGDSRISDVLMRHALSDYCGLHSFGWAGVACSHSRSSGSARVWRYFAGCIMTLKSSCCRCLLAGPLSARQELPLAMEPLIGRPTLCQGSGQVSRHSCC